MGFQSLSQRKMVLWCKKQCSMLAEVVLSTMHWQHIVFFLIHMCIQCLGHFSSSPHPLPLPPTPSLPGRNYFALISNFVEERV
jgi:hypothetical protein